MNKKNAPKISKKRKDIDKYCQRKVKEQENRHGKTGWVFEWNLQNASTILALHLTTIATTVIKSIGVGATDSVANLLV